MSSLYTVERIRVIVVDDSRFFRQMISQGVMTAPFIEVVATSGDPVEALTLIQSQKPDVVLCDVEMPGMTGIELVRRLMAVYPVPVIMVSSLESAVFDALRAGAVDFVGKPDARSLTNVEAFFEDLHYKIRAAVVSNVQRPGSQSVFRREDDVGQTDISVVAIGASTGGTEAVASLLKSLPRDIPGIVIAQHIPPVFSDMFAKRLDMQTPFQVQEAVTGAPVLPGTVWIAPGDQHIRLVKRQHRYVIECFHGERVNGHRPAIDVLFESVARAAGKDALGVILTGMGNDGAKGLLEMRRKGARTVGQDEATSVVYGMPKLAYEVGAVEKQVPLERIPSAIVAMLKPSSRRRQTN